MKTIDIYKDKLFIRFKESGENFKPISSFPHYKYWTKIIKYLRHRGFTVKTPLYWENNKYGKAEHKVAFKDNVAITLECMASQIKIEFGDVKNLWKDWGFNFWSLTDDRSKPLTYLENKKVQLEVNKLIKTFPQELLVYNDIQLSPAEKIIKNKKESCHSGDKDKLDELGLDGVQYQMSKYDVKQNSSDRNKKQILNGELKYYYNRRRLVCGKVYHDLNNTWIVLLPDGLDYVSSWELFDLNGEVRKKKLTKEEQLNRLEKELNRYEGKKNYLKCIAINKELEKLKATEKIYNIWSIKHGSWWGANNGGYTSDRKHAGIYLESNVLKSKNYYDDGISTKTILI